MSRGEASGGTSQTVLSLLDKYSWKEIGAANKTWALSPVRGARYSKATNIVGTRNVPELGTLTTSFFATTNRGIVHRSWGLIGGGKVYGPKFHYSEYMAVRNIIIGIFVNLAFVLGVFAVALPPVR